MTDLPVHLAAACASTYFCVTLPLKVWNNTRNEVKLEEQERLLIQARRALHVARHAREVVVLHAASDAAQFVVDGDADATEMFGIADAGKLEDVRRADCAGGQDHRA